MITLKKQNMNNIIWLTNPLSGHSYTEYSRNIAKTRLYHVLTLMQNSLAVYGSCKEKKLTSTKNHTQSSVHDPLYQAI